jgi:hypothetical protein
VAHFSVSEVVQFSMSVDKRDLYAASALLAFFLQSGWQLDLISFEVLEVWHHRHSLADEYVRLPAD